jgi:precorrin-6Y C5,15-methyltransferase (decarboxylating)
MTEWLCIVGIGEDGWDGLGAAAKTAITSAEILVGGARHLALLSESKAVRFVWPMPMLPAIDELLKTHRGNRQVVVLASGDPMLYGVGNVLARRLAPYEFRVIPAVSAFTIACARLGWSCADVQLVSIVHRPVEQIKRLLQPGHQIIVFSEDGGSPKRLVEHLILAGYGSSMVSVLEHLGGPKEHRVDAVAKEWVPRRCADLNVVAIACIADQGTSLLSTVPGLPESAFETDGQLTKREVRSATLARLVPLPGQLLWDVGAGTGSICIEWMRANRSNRAIAFERRQDRADLIVRNAKRLGVPGLCVVTGPAPAILSQAEPPDAVFIGGGISGGALVHTCWEALRCGGRLVANAVTIAGEVELAKCQATFGGDLTRISISRAELVGGVLGWRSLTPVTQWAVTKQ